MNFKPLFSRALSLAPDRRHFAAHSHHLWPDASHEAQGRAWDEANRHADRKWDLVFGEVVPEAQGHVACELGLPDPDRVVFAANTHDLLIRIVSALDRPGPLRVLSTDGEFHSFRRQAQRWEEAGIMTATRIATAPSADFEARFLDAARAGAPDGRPWDLIVVSQVFFRSGGVFAALEALAALASPEGTWVVVDGYHGFMATPTDLGACADRLFYLAGGYKYAMAGEGAGLMHAPPGFGARPAVTGWFAEFGDLSGPPGGVAYRTDAGRFWGATMEPTPLYRFNAVRRMLDAAGLTTADVAAHARSLAERFQAGLTTGEAGRLSEAEILNPVEGTAPRARFLALRHPQAGVWRAALLERGVVADVRDDVIRFGFGLYQDEADVEVLIRRCRAL